MGVGWCFGGGLCCDIASLVVCLEPGFIGVGVADEGERDGVVVRVCVDHGHVRVAEFLQRNSILKRLGCSGDIYQNNFFKKVKLVTYTKMDNMFFRKCF